MLTQEILKATPSVSALPSEVQEALIKEITELSANAFKERMDAKTVEWATGIEKDVFETSGIEKGKDGNGKSERYFDYAKRVIQTLKEKADKAGDTSEIDKLKAEVEAAKKALKDNTGDATLKADLEQARQALADERSRIADFQKQLQTTREEANKRVEAEAAKLNQYRTLTEFEKAKNQFQFEDEKIIPKEVRETYAKSAFEKILSTKPHEWRKAGDQEHLVFLKPDGTVENNPERGLNPYTLADYLEKELAPILAKGHQQSGAGTKGSAGGNGQQKTVVNLSFAKSRSEVDEIINSDLMARGISKSHPDYDKSYQEAKKTVANFDSLPMETR